jgi:hypothetical protein
VLRITLGDLDAPARCASRMSSAVPPAPHRGHRPRAVAPAPYPGAMRSLPPVGLLLDVDGPIASPVTRRVPAAILAALVDLGRRGIPVVFNTGRSADFVLQQVAGPLRAAGLPADARFHAVCEKGAVHFSFADLPDGALPSVSREAGVPAWVAVDEGMRLPAALESHLVQLVRPYAGTMFHDDTKLAMFSAEMNVGVPHELYRRDQRAFEEEATALLSGDRTGAAAQDLSRFQLDSTIISTDVEHASSGKDLGAARSWDLVAADGELPARWFTCGDSRTDYAMADWLHHRGVPVEHVDVRPSDGVPDTGYPVLTSRELSSAGFGPSDGHHEVTGQAFLEWALNTLVVPEATV